MASVGGFLRRAGVRRAATAGLSAAVFVIALVVLHRAIGEFDPADVLAEAKGYRPRVLVGALSLVLASYVALSGFDWLALRHMRRDVPLGWTGLISFVSHAISHNAGFAALTGGAVRLRMYSAFGLSLREVGGVMAFAGLTFALGAASLASAAFIAASDKAAILIGIPEALVAGAGWGMALLVCAYLSWTALARQPLFLWRWRVEPPSLGVGIGQILVAATDLALVAGALYLLLPAGLPVTFPAFVGIYVMATLTGTLSHVPGGLGVFEGALVLLLPEAMPAAILGALLVFRVFYNLVPLLLGAAILAVFEVMQRSAAARAPWLEALGPALAAALVFSAGAILLVTAAVADPPALPQWLAEPAHLLSAVAGTLMLLGSHALARQEEWGYRICLPSLAAGALLALARGPDWTPAFLLAATTGLLSAAAPLFHRAGGNSAGRLPWAWIGAAVAVVAGAWWLTLHADQAGFRALERLLRFAGGDEGARALRGDLVAAITLAAAIVAGRWPALRRTS